MYYDKLPLPINLLLFQYFKIENDKRIQSLDPSNIITVKNLSDIRLVCKEWYKYENMSRCKYCKGRYTLNNNQKFICFRCGHNIKFNYKQISLRELIWNYKLYKVHYILRIMYKFGSKRNSKYIWAGGKLKWIKPQELSQKAGYC